MKKTVLLITFILIVSSLFGEYALRVGDTIRIEVFGYQEMSRDCIVDSDGFISYVGVGRIKVSGMTLNDLEKIINEKVAKLIPNPAVSASLVSYAPRYVYIHGIVNTRIDIGINPTMLSQIISIVGRHGTDFSTKMIDLENIRIMRGRESFLVDLSSFYYEGRLDADVPVYENDIIYIPQKSLLGYVKVLGAVKNPSALSYTKGLTLSAAISLSGGIVTDLGDPQNIYLTRSGTVQRINLEEILTGRIPDVDLKPGDQIYIPKIDLRYAYIVGFVTKPGVYEFLKDEPLTLKRLIAKAGGIAGDTKYVDKILVTQDNVQKEYTSTFLMGNDDVPIAVGCYVDVLKKPERFVYVAGQVKNPGRIDFQPEEQMKMSIVVPKVGGYLSEQVERGGKVKIQRGSKIFEFAIRELKDNDFELQSGDLIKVEYDEFYVYVIGPLPVSGKISLDPEEPRRLSTVLKKIGQIDDRTFESIQLIQQREVSRYNVKDIIDSSVDTEIENQSTIVFISRQGRYIYFVGDLSQFVSFGTDEEFTLTRALAKVNLQTSYIESIVKVESEQEQIIELDRDLPLKSGEIYKITVKKPIKVTVLGKVREPGQVVFEVNEQATLKKAVARCGGLITGADQLYVSDQVIVYSSGERHLFSAKEIESQDLQFTLKDGDFVYVTEKTPHYVFVFGDTVTNKKIELSQNEPFDLSNILGRVNTTAETQFIQVIFPTNEATTVSIKDIQLGKKNVQLVDGAFLIFERDFKSYVYVLGMVGKPGGYYVGDRELTLLEVVSMAGGVSGWGSYNQIILRRGNESKSFDMSNPLTLNNIVVKAGDVVYVPPIEANIVYVLGQVSRPGVVKIDQYSTVLDAIMKCGGFTTRAITSKVYLFKGGPNGEPVVCDLSGTMRGKPTTANPSVSPGDVIFVPDNPLMNIVDLIPIISSVVSLISDVQGLIQ